MSSSLREQLLKAGLVTAEQADQASQKKPYRGPHSKGKATTNTQRRQSSKRENQRLSQEKQPAKKTQPAPASPVKSRKKSSDLARFYQERTAVERAEREAEEQRKREAAAVKKRTRQQVRKLITDNLQNKDDAIIRYNFVIDTSVKYVFVTEAQQTALADGSLSITFMDGKRCLISREIAQQIQTLDPNKIVVINEPDVPKEAEAAPS